MMFQAPSNKGWELVDCYFSRRLQDLLDQRVMTGKDLEDSGIISASSVKEYLENGRLPSLRTACRIADFFDVTLDWLCGYGADLPIDISSGLDPEADRRAPWLKS